MKNKLMPILLTAFFMGSHAAAAHAAQPNEQTEKHRILISTDIGGTDPDDNQSMAHFLMYCNEFYTEGLVSSPSYGSGSKSEILRMIDLYEKDLPKLKKHAKGWAEPDYLRSITKQGRKGAAPYCGYSTPTEGSEWIVRCARKDSRLPLYVLVWGGLDDVAQALHDAPDIADKIRIYWIGGPNKKWSMNSYVYIVENFPDLWFIENNVSYRGFICDNRNKGIYDTGFYDTFVKGAGHLGSDFANYLNGRPKLGDTPSLLYMMKGNPADVEKESWGGSFEPCSHSARVVFNRPATANDTVQVYAVMEFHVKGPVRNDISIGSPCIRLTIANQSWDGFYLGNGDYVVRYSTYKTGTQAYSIVSDIPGFPDQKGEITLENIWPGRRRSTDYMVGKQWFTDKSAPDLFWKGLQGAMTVFKWRHEAMADWGRRWGWLK